MPPISKIVIERPAEDFHATDLETLWAAATRLNGSSPPSCEVLQRLVRQDCVPGTQFEIPLRSTTQSTNLARSGDAREMPAVCGLFQRVILTARSLEGADGRFRASVSAAEIPVPGDFRVGC